MVQTRAAGLRGSLGAMWQPAPSPDFYCQHLPASSGGTCTTKMKQCFICNCAKLQQDFVPWGAAPAFLQLGDAAQWQKCGCVPPTFNSGCAALCFAQSSENLGSVGLCYGSCHISLFAGNIEQPLTSCSTMELNGAHENILDCVHPQMLGRLRKK